MDALTVQPRVGRFSRRIDPQPMALTARDLKLLAHVARYRFLTSAQLAALDGGSPQNVVRSLRLLFDHGYLDRPASHLVMVPLQGTRPLVYALGQRGARALRAHGHLLDDRVDWTEKNKRAGAVFIEHTLAVADFLSGLEVACRGQADIEVIGEEKVLALAPAATRAAREPLRFAVDKAVMGRRQHYSVVPDGLFGLRFADDSASYFMLEVDRGTIPISRTGSKGRGAWQKSITYKLATYWEGWKAGRHVAQFGLKQMRVLMLTSSEERMNNMLGVVDELTQGRGSAFFLFGHTALLRDADPLTVGWTSGRRQPVRLTD
jgi:Replication-relaxation